MEYLPSVELLNELHDFPGPYMFKVIGWAKDGFVARVLHAVREELDAEADPPFKLRQTPSGRHVAITLEPNVDTADDVISVYQRVRTIPGLIMLC